MDSLGQRPLTLPQVATAAEVEYATLHSWLKRGLLTASVQASTGTGSPNLFSPRDALTARVLADLRRTGVDLDSMEKASNELQKQGENLTGEEVLVVNGRVELLDSTQPLADVLREREPAVIYELAWAREAVEAVAAG
jgi:DNA-binding transcriptional MerR regulator